MSREIRKISVGKDFPDGCLHYQVGKSMKLAGVLYTIQTITKSIENKVKGYNVLLSNELGTVHWKRVEGVPVVLEYNINFD